MQSITAIKPMPVICTVVQVLICMSILPACLYAQTFTPYSCFQGLSDSQLDSLRVKLTYGGPQNMPIQTLVFALSATPVSTSQYSAFQRPGFDYANDAGPVVSFTLTAKELRSVLDTVASLPRVTDGDFEVNADVSYALLHSSGSTIRVFESIVSDTTGRQLFGRLLDALRSSSDGVQLLRDYGCASSLLPQQTPMNVGGMVSVHLEGLRRDRIKHDTFYGKMSIQNTSGTTIPAPVYLIVILEGNTSLLAADGFTCNIANKGSGFVVVSLGNMAPGATVHKTLRFGHASNDKFTTDFRVFAGVGTP